MCGIANNMNDEIIDYCADYYVAKVCNSGATFIVTPNRCPVTKTQALVLRDMCEAAEPNEEFILLTNPDVSRPVETEPNNI